MTDRRPAAPPGPAGATPSLRPEARADALIARMTLPEKAAPAVRRVGGRVRRGRRSRPAPARDGGAGRPGRTAAAGPGPAHPAVRHRAGRPRRSARCRCCAPSARSWPPTGSASRRSPTRSAWPGSPPGAPPPTRVPLAWGATFDPALIEQMAARDRPRHARGRRPPGPRAGARRGARRRWGRVEETIGEDPYLVGDARHRLRAGAGVRRDRRHAQALRRLLRLPRRPQPRAGRHGPRASCADVILPPFEMAVRERGARSVMHSYTDTDGIPRRADERLLTGLLRDTWGFTGTVVVRLLRHRLPQDPARRRRDARRRGRHGAGRGRGRGTARHVGLRRAAARGASPTARCRRTCSTGRCAGADAEGASSACSTPTGRPGGRARRPRHDLDSPAQPRIARRLAERSLVLLDDAAPRCLLARRRSPARSGSPSSAPAPTTRSRARLLLLPHPRRPQHPDSPVGIELPSAVRGAARRVPGQPRSCTARAATVDGTTGRLRRGAVAAAADADVWSLALGDRAGLFGRGTTGEGCDADVSGAARRAGRLARRAAGHRRPPVVLVVVSGRPVRARARRRRAAALVQAFFPGEEGAPAIAGVSPAASTRPAGCR